MTGEFDGPGGEKRREDIRREQQVILDSIKRSSGNSSNSGSANSSPTDSNGSATGGRKVRWAAKQAHPSASPPVVHDTVVKFDGADPPTDARTRRTYSSNSSAAAAPSRVLRVRALRG